ncbi:MAG: hypothetical protein ACREMY_29895, partial [bacterium]
MGKLDKSVVIVASGLMLLHFNARASELSFADRVEAQRRIEQIYYSHQIGVSTPFESAIDGAFLERKVRTYLKESSALEQYWGTPVTAHMLERELERIAAGTRLLSRLKEVYAALGNDPVLIQETFVRGILV